MAYVSRAGKKLEYALKHFNIDVKDLTCADFGSSTGGFVDCLLQSGAKKVYAVETGYGVLDWKLRNDIRVVVMERSNAMHIELPEKVDLITIDVGWTRLEKVITNSFNNLKDGGRVIALLKPHYEAEPRILQKGRLPDDAILEVTNLVEEKLKNLKAKIVERVESPLVGVKGGNREYFVLIGK